MSMRENIQFFHPLGIEEYLDILKKEYGARDHPLQMECFLVGDPELPFYKPQRQGDHVFVISFNHIPLSDLLVKALIDHPELAPDDMVIRWTLEQEIILEEKLGSLRKQFGENNREKP